MSSHVYLEMYILWHYVSGLKGHGRWANFPRLRHALKETGNIYGDLRSTEGWRIELCFLDLTITEGDFPNQAIYSVHRSEGRSTHYYLFNVPLTREYIGFCLLPPYRRWLMAAFYLRCFSGTWERINRWDLITYALTPTQQAKVINTMAFFFSPASFHQLAEYNTHSWFTLHLEEELWKAESQLNGCEFWKLSCIPELSAQSILAQDKQRVTGLRPTRSSALRGRNFLHCTFTRGIMG